MRFCEKVNEEAVISAIIWSNPYPEVSDFFLELFKNINWQFDVKEKALIFIFFHLRWFFLFE